MKGCSLIFTVVLLYSRQAEGMNTQGAIQGPVVAKVYN